MQLLQMPMKKCSFRSDYNIWRQWFYRWWKRRKTCKNDAKSANGAGNTAKTYDGPRKEFKNVMMAVALAEVKIR